MKVNSKRYTFNSQHENEVVDKAWIESSSANPSEPDNLHGLVNWLTRSGLRIVSWRRNWGKTTIKLKTKSFYGYYIQPSLEITDDELRYLQLVFPHHTSGVDYMAIVNSPEPLFPGLWDDLLDTPMDRGTPTTSPDELPPVLQNLTPKGA